jgi:hypothetical protein
MGGRLPLTVQVKTKLWNPCICNVPCTGNISVYVRVCVHFSKHAYFKFIYFVLLKTGRTPVIKTETSLGILSRKGFNKRIFRRVWKKGKRLGRTVLTGSWWSAPALLDGQFQSPPHM